MELGLGTHMGPIDSKLMDSPSFGGLAERARSNFESPSLEKLLESEVQLLTSQAQGMRGQEMAQDDNSDQNQLENMKKSIIPTELMVKKWKSRARAHIEQSSTTEWKVGMKRTTECLC
ncbi:hypothetical protein U1Q18_006813 [Sarracenia purpurea var. burkii]